MKPSNNGIHRLTDAGDAGEPGPDESDVRKVTVKPSDKISSQGIQPKVAEKNLLSYPHK
jgi:hypothetical protein